MSFAECRLAAPADDPALRRILRENPFEGSISLSFEREPNYFCAADVEGPFHQTMVVCESQTGDIMGMGDRSVRPLWVNGEMRDVGYFSGLRAHKKYRSGLALARFVQQGFEYYQQAHSDGRAPFYLISVIDDNSPARRLLTFGLKGLPHLREYTRMFTYAVHPARPKPELPLPRGVKMQRGSPDLIPALVDCLNRNGARKQFSLYWENDMLRFDDAQRGLSALTPALMIDDFFLALDRDRVIGCLALWDQQSFKQTVVRGYSGNMARFRKLINVLSPLGGWPKLPDAGTRLNQCFACFLAIDDDDPAVFAALLRAFYNEAAMRRYDYFIIGMTDSNPLGNIVKSHRPITYASRIYLAGWEDCMQAISQVDARPPALEVAVL